MNKCETAVALLFRPPEFPNAERETFSSVLQKWKFTYMTFDKLIPNVYYPDIHNGVKFFCDCLGFSIGHNEINSKQPFCVLEKDGLRINLFEEKKLAKGHNPEFRLVTKSIEGVFGQVSKSHPEFLHPNLSAVTLRPWGAKEFALRDEQVCVIVQQW